MACIFCDKPYVFFDVPQRGIFVAIITDFLCSFLLLRGMICNTSESVP